MSRTLKAQKVILDLKELKHCPSTGWEYIASNTVLSPVPETLEDAEREVRSLNVRGRVFCG